MANSKSKTSEKTILKAQAIVDGINAAAEQRELNRPGFRGGWLV